METDCGATRDASRQDTIDATRDRGRETPCASTPDCSRMDISGDEGAAASSGSGVKLRAGGGVRAGVKGELAAVEVNDIACPVVSQVNAFACPIAKNNQEPHTPSFITGWSVLSLEKWDKEKRRWFTGGNEAGYKAGSFNMCLRHMGFRPTKSARYGGSGYDWETSVGFVFDGEMRAKYISKRSHNSTRGTNKR